MVIGKENGTVYLAGYYFTIYTVTWKNGDDVIKTDTVEEGAIPAYTGTVPEKAEDEINTYTFSGWTDGTNTYGATDTLPAVTGDITYTATYTATEKATEAPTEVPTDPVTVYFKAAQDWWKADGAAVGVYYWSDSDQPVDWPGVRMEKVAGETDIWKYEIPAGFTNVIFARISPSGDVEDWGAKTADLTLPTDGKNMYIVTSESPVWGDPGVTGEWGTYTATEPTEAPTPAKPQAGDILPESDYLTFTAVEAGSSVTMNFDSGSDFQYNKNNSGWVSYDSYSQITLENEGDSVSFSGKDVTFNSTYHVVIDGKVACSGNVMSLRLSDGVIQGLSENCFECMFDGCTGLTTAPELPETALAPHCYESMFRHCESLTAAPELPATTLESDCYSSMFVSCESLTTAPELPATTLAPYCYRNMFASCKNLTVAPGLPATTLVNNCYDYMFADCEKLTTAPELPATTIADYCYSNMFYGCESLSELPELPATTLASMCYYNMFSNCSKIYISDEAGTFDGITYSAEYRIPSSGTGKSATYALYNMFGSTGGKFKGTPNINTTYYIPAPAAEPTEAPTEAPTELPDAIKDCTYKNANSNVFANVPLIDGFGNFAPLADGAIYAEEPSETMQMIDAKGYSYKFYDQTGTEIAADLSDSTTAPGSRVGLGDDVTLHGYLFNLNIPENFEGVLYIVATAPTVAPTEAPTEAPTYTVTWKNGDEINQTELVALLINMPPTARRIPSPRSQATRPSPRSLMRSRSLRRATTS